MPKAVVVGEKSQILGFKGVGFEIVPAQGAEHVAEALAKLARDPGLTLALLTESAAAEAPEAIEDFREKSAAILTLIPTHAGSRHVSFDNMRKAVEHSLGVDILGKD